MYTQTSTPSIDPALRALLAVAEKVTPSGQPTIAAQVAQAAGQQQQPQGIEAALGQAEQAAPSVAQNMQQQQMAQMLQQAQQAQPAQPQPQPQQSAGGIAALPIPEGAYAEGGVVGYAGPDGSYVDIMGMLTGMEQPEYAAGEDPRTASERQADEIRALMKAKAKAEAGEEAELRQKIKERARTREGIGSVRPAAPIGATTGESQFPRPTAAEASGIAAGIVPRTDRAESKRLYELQKSLQEGRPDFEAMKARALEEAYSRDKSGRGIEQLIRFANATAQQGLGGIGVESLRYAKEKAALDAAHRDKLIALEEAKYAQKTGNVKDLMEANAKIEAAQQKENELLGQVGGNAYTALTNQRGDELRLAGQAAAARSRIAAAAIKAATAKPAARPTYAEQKILEELVDQRFASPATILKSPEARTIISRMPGGTKLLTDLREENITPEEFMDKPLVVSAREMYRQMLEAQGKYGSSARVKDIDSAEAELDDTED